MQESILLEKPNIPDLEAEVKRLQSEGWRLQGSLTIAPGDVYRKYKQWMVQEKPKKSPRPDKGSLTDLIF